MPPSSFLFSFLFLMQNVNPEEDKLLNYNSAELEDCDVVPEASFSITHFDESLKPSQVVSSPTVTSDLRSVPTTCFS